MPFKLPDVATVHSSELFALQSSAVCTVPGGPSQEGNRNDLLDLTSRRSATGHHLFNIQPLPLLKLWYYGATLAPRTRKIICTLVLRIGHAATPAHL